MFLKSLKTVFKSKEFKEMKNFLDDLQTTKESLIDQVIKKKSNQIFLQDIFHRYSHVI